MTRSLLLFSAFAFAVGCDAVSHTHIVVLQDASGGAEYSSEAEADVIRVTRDSATRLGLAERESGEAGVFFDDVVPGQNPRIYLGVKQDRNAVRVEIAELYTSSRTDKHDQLVESLMRNFAVNGLDAEIIYQTRNSRAWLWLLATATATLGLVFWGGARALRKPSCASATEP
jgi:hypothetical protein